MRNVLLSSTVASAHVVSKHPAPRLDSSNYLKQYPCGSGTQYNDFATGLTELSPGPNVFTFKETINHVGAPYRIAISAINDDQYDTHVLLDHIPHNDAGSTGGGGKLHAVQIEVPDIDCITQQCAIQVIQIMTDKFAGVCAPADLSNSCGSPSYAYFSCANVKINGTQTLASLGSFYKALDGSTTAYGWTDESTTWTQRSDGYWVIPGQITTPFTVATGAPTTTTPIVPSSAPPPTTAPPPTADTSFALATTATATAAMSLVLALLL